jgi:hypothetical protein|tara:strand:+ start:186 stop:386 length:201 start_codon:yes stop_codon:yes gene_type:complete
LPREAKVSKKSVTFLIKDYVIGLQVPEDDILSMKSLDTTYYLGHITSRFLFRERALEFQVLAKVTS